MLKQSPLQKGRTPPLDAVPLNMCPTLTCSTRDPLNQLVGPALIPFRQVDGVDAGSLKILGPRG